MDQLRVVARVDAATRYVVPSGLPIRARRSLQVLAVRPLILIVDDEPDIRTVLAHSLLDEGYRVVSAADGEEALGHIAVEVPDVIVSDIRMPKVGGLALIQRLRSTGLLTPIILISTWTPPVGMPGVRFVPKPFDLDRITEAIELSLSGTG